jgi:hypothetical protein
MQVATFVIAVLGAVIGVASFAWNVATYIRSGGRVAVTLNTGARHHEAGWIEIEIGAVGELVVDGSM